MDGNRLDAHFAAGAMNAQRDFAPICDEYFFEHGPVAYSTMMSGSPNSTGWPSSTSIFVTVPALVAGMWFMVFMASMISRSEEHTSELQTLIRTTYFPTCSCHDPLPISASGVEWTATVLMPISRQAR